MVIEIVFVLLCEDIQFHVVSARWVESSLKIPKALAASFEAGKGCAMT